jgi:two-component system sensor histidine kinase BaeS
LQLSLLIASAVVVAVIVVGGLSFLNLRSGFRDYLQVRDDEQLMRFVTMVERHAATDTELQWLRQDPDPMRTLMDEFAGRAPRGQRPPPPQRGYDRPPPRPENGAPGQPPPFKRPGAAEGDEQQQQQQPPPPRAGDPPPRTQRGTAGATVGQGSLGERLLLRDTQGMRLAGRPQPQDAKRTTRAIKANGVEVAYVDLLPEPEPEGVDARFLQRQTSRLVWAALGTILAAVLAAWWMAGRWSRPLLALQSASRDIARGRRPDPLQPTGAREIAQLMEDVNTMTAELARLETARRVWIAQISHELRTPLSVLRGEMEAIEDGARQPTPQVMSSLRDEVMQLTRLVDDLHTLSVADVDGLRCDFTPGDAHAGLWRVTQRFEAQAQQRGLTLQLPPRIAAPINVNWDFGRIEQLLANLLTNSLRYTDAPGSIAVGWNSDGRIVTLTVDDSAPGVSDADMRELFEPLFRGDKARQRSDGQHGSGLGLAIARSIVHAHKGTISASASQRGGLQLCVCLPVQPKMATGRGNA